MSGKSSKSNRTGNGRPASQTHTLREQKRAQFEEPRRRTTLRVVLAGVALLVVVAAAVVTMRGGEGTAATTTPAAPGGDVKIALADVSDGKAHCSSYDAGGTQVEYFVLKSADGKVRAAFDACDVCFAQKKGYHQEGDEMMCNDCGRRFPSTKIIRAAGGCNPSPVERTVKGTFLSILGGLSHPGAGSISVDVIDLYKLPGERLADFRREYLGFVFQSFNLVPYLTVLENVTLPLAVKKMPSAEKGGRALEVLEHVGLADRAGHLPGQLSGGEQERVAIARALVNEPPSILADEPTGALDSETTVEIMDVFADLHREGIMILMVTHNLEIRRYFDRTIVLWDGRLDCELPACDVGMPL